jgi:hypothetical protein
MASITRTSRSLLLNRVVRVERREKIDDGMGGTYPEYTTIINRYHVWLEPQQHQRRERRELGEQQTTNDYRAGGHPTHNGISIMIGDRFHDVKNNECYDVVAVKRPRPGLAYAAMTHYELVLVKDGCPPEAEPPYETSASTAGGSGNTQTLFIMRHLSNNEIFGWELLPYFDGVIYNLQYDDPAQLAQLAAVVAAGRRWWRYYTVLEYPYSGTLFGGLVPPFATWFNWLRDNIQFSGSTSHRRFRVADTVALFNANPAGIPPEQRELIAWPLITAGERAAIIAQMVALADGPGGVPIPAAGVFFDQAWLNLPSFFVEDTLTNESGHGNVKEGSPKLTALDYAGTEAAFGDGGTWNTHRASLVALYAEIATALGATRYAIKNAENLPQGGDVVPKPWLIENAWNNLRYGGTQPERWANAKAAFVTDSRNILSIKCESAPNALIGVPDAIAYWQQVGGWLSFTDDGSVQGAANREAAYADAATVLAAHGWPN